MQMAKVEYVIVGRSLPAQLTAFTGNDCNRLSDANVSGRNISQRRRLITPAGQKDVLLILNPRVCDKWRQRELCACQHSLVLVELFLNLTGREH